MNQLDLDYQNLLKDILENGIQKNDRTSTGTLSVFGRTIKYSFKDGKFPLLTTKKMAFKVMVTELLWFLKGDTCIKYLVDNDCNIWNGDAYQAYLNHFLGLEDVPSKEWFVDKIKTNDEFAAKFGELGPIYGKQWRSWRGQDGMIGEKDENGTRIITWNQIDQIANLINELKTNPDSRRMIVSAWNVGDLPHQVLPPCHYGFQVYTRELSKSERMDYWFKNNKPNRDVCDSIDDSSEEEQHKYFDGANVPKRAISLMFNMRSTDVGLGLGFNLASYGLLLMMIAKQVNMIPDELVYNGGDVHLYLNHVEPIKEQLTRKPYSLPTVKISDRVVNDISEYTLDDFTLENYQYYPTIRMPLSN